MHARHGQPGALGHLRGREPGTYALRGNSSAAAPPHKASSVPPQRLVVLGAAHPAAQPKQAPRSSSTRSAQKPAQGSRLPRLLLLLTAAFSPPGERSRLEGARPWLRRGEERCGAGGFCRACALFCASIFSEGQRLQIPHGVHCFLQTMSSSK